MLWVERNLNHLPQALKPYANADGLIADVEAFLEAATRSRSKKLRISQEVDPWWQSRQQDTERKYLQRQYEQKVVSGEYPTHETKLPLYPYQREGMLHLAFKERALLADEMGLGKTIQAVAACALLHRMGKAKRVLVVTPASLKSEWEEQIAKFTDLPSCVVYGSPTKRRESYRNGTFFTMVNYEQVMRDFEVINTQMRPDIVVLDEAQRIKNWNTKTAQSIKKLESRYAFVLTGTPIENRIDDLYSIVNFIKPTLLGSLFRFNREFYTFDGRGRPAQYQNLERLRERVGPLMLRRRKADVETELPVRTDRTLFVSMTEIQNHHYKQHEQQVSILKNKAKIRPLRLEELEKLQRELAMMRMLCDTPYILDPEDKTCPKLDEIRMLLEEVLSQDDTKVVIFSEWVKMLELIRESCQSNGIESVWHTGRVPQQKRREEINRFKSNKNARVFLSSDAGGVGLNLQNASVVINCDLPWNPAKLEQRIARVWRKHQKRPVTVINLVSEKTIEHRMLDTLADKQGLADAVIDGSAAFDEVKLSSGSEKFFERIKVLMDRPYESKKDTPGQIPKHKQAHHFARCLADEFGAKMVSCNAHRIGTDLKIIITLEANPQQVNDHILSLSKTIFGSDNNIGIEIMDRQTAEAIQRLIEAGLLKPTADAQSLFPGATEKPGLPDAVLMRMKELKTDAQRKCSMAKLLVDNQFADGAVQPLQETIELLTIHNILQTGGAEPARADIDFNSHWQSEILSFMTTPNPTDVPNIIKVIEQHL